MSFNILEYLSVLGHLVFRGKFQILDILCIFLLFPCFCINFGSNFLPETFYEILENVHKVKQVVFVWCLDVHSPCCNGVNEVNRVRLTLKNMYLYLYPVFQYTSQLAHPTCYVWVYFLTDFSSPHFIPDWWDVIQSHNPANIQIFSQLLGSSHGRLVDCSLQALGIKIQDTSESF